MGELKIFFGICFVGDLKEPTWYLSSGCSIKEKILELVMLVISFLLL